MSLRKVACHPEQLMTTSPWAANNVFWALFQDTLPDHELQGCPTQKGNMANIVAPTDRSSERYVQTVMGDARNSKL